MFSYYGSKSKLVNYYPAPKHPKIIEPFAGSARYALKWFDRDVLLVEKNEVVVRIWKWLQRANPQDILDMPRLKQGDDIRNYKLSEDEILFLGFLAGHGDTGPRYKVSPFADYENGNQTVYNVIASQLFKIRHWEIKQGDYRDIPNQEATWFIDPPYFMGGYRYRAPALDYAALALWCQSRLGQVIVCENTKAHWLPFWPLKNIQGCANSNTTEAIWCNEFNQLPLFAQMEST